MELIISMLEVSVSSLAKAVTALADIVRGHNTKIHQLEERIEHLECLLMKVSEKLGLAEDDKNGE